MQIAEWIKLWAQVPRGPAGEGGTGEGGSGEGGTGEGGTGEGGTGEGGTGEGGTGEGGTGEGGTGEGGTGEGGTGEGGPKWFEDKRFDDDTKTQLKALGLTVEDPLDAVKSLTAMERAAKQKLGTSPENLIEKPGEGKDAAEWLRENGDMFGIPAAPDKYEVNQPESWPKDQQWDSDLEGQARAIAHEEGVPQKALQRLTDLYAGKMVGMMGQADDALAEAETEMRTELQKDWGDQYPAKIAQVQQVSGVLAEAAGLDQAAMEGVAAALDPKIGSANTIRLFEAVARMAGDDSALLLTGGNNLGTTPADARAKIEAMKAPDSDYQKALKTANTGGDRAEFDRLHKEYMRLQKIASPTKKK